MQIQFWIVVVIPICAATGNWYWRDYDGIIPNDAFVAGIDELGQVYIGQGYCDSGLYTGRVFPGYNLEIWCATAGTTAKIGTPKILCSDQMWSFSWLKVNNGTFHVDIKDKTLVIGGFHRDLGKVHVARASMDGHIQIGYSTTYYDEPWMNSQINGTSQPALDYEVLIYNILRKNK